MRGSLRGIGVLLAVLSPLTGYSAKREVVALHPLVVVGGDPDERLHGLLAAEVVKQDVDLVDSELVRQHLKAVPGEACVEDEACLAELARATGATRTLLVTLSPYSPKLVLTGKLVSAQGRVLKTLDGQEFERPSDDAPDAYREAFAALLERLDLAEMELPSLVPVAPPPPTAEVQSGPLTVDDEGKTLRLAGVALLGAGVAAGIAASVVAVNAQANHQALKSRLTPDGYLPEGDAEAARLQRGLRAQAGWTTGLLVGAGAAVASGAVLYLLGMPRSVGLFGSDTGAQVSLQGTF